MRLSRGRAALLVSLVAGICLFAGLAVWQVERRAWKHALIAQVDARLHAAPIDAPATIDAASDAYRRVQVTGRFIAGRDTFVRAATDLGSGYWVMTPLQRPDGSVVLVNRGFVSGDDRGRVASVQTDSSASITITGLLRDNEPSKDRWVTRDVEAIAKARGLRRVVPYFVDADPGPAEDEPRSRPVGGLTVVAFSDNHLLYAIVWSVLAVMCGVAVIRVLRHPPVV